MIRVLALAAVALGALSTGGCGLFTGDAVVMISGRDDHGDLQRPHVGLQASPTDTSIAATARDGEIAHVKERRGPWARIALVRTGEQGWIEDHYLRGDAVHHGTRPRRARFIAAERSGAEVRVRVRYGDDGTEAWVAASELKEIGAR